MPRTTHIFAPMSIILGLWGSLLLTGAAGGSDDPWQPLKVFSASPQRITSVPHDLFLTVTDPNVLQDELDAAKNRGQWVLIDYYADWCVSCKRMEKQVFAKPEVLDALQSVLVLRLDISADSLDSRNLLERFKVPGPPTLLWIGPDGIERRERRISGEVSAETFLQTWQATQEQG